MKKIISNFISNNNKKIFVFFLLFVFLYPLIGWAAWVTPTGSPTMSNQRNPIFNEEPNLSAKVYALIDRILSVTGNLNILGSVTSLGGLDITGNVDISGALTNNSTLRAANNYVVGQVNSSNSIRAEQLCNLNNTNCRDLTKSWSFSGNVESDPSVAAKYKDGVRYYELENLLPGFEDGNDNRGDKSFYNYCSVMPSYCVLEVDPVTYSYFDPAPTMIIGIGDNSLDLMNFSASYDIAIGAESSNLLTSGDDTITVGYYAGNGITASYRNVLLGSNCRVSDGPDTSVGNVGAGYRAFANSVSANDSDYNVAVGNNSVGIGRADYNVGIGSWALGHTGMEDGNTAVGYSSLVINGAGANNVAIGYMAGSDTTVADNRLYIANAAGTPLIGGDFSTNNLYVDGTLVHSSDIRLKKDIKNLSNSLEKVMNLQGVSFKWKETGEKDFGFIAQDVEKIYPEIVKINEATTEKYKTLEYGNLLAPLVETIKEQQQELSAQQIKIAELKARVKILKEKNNN